MYPSISNYHSLDAVRPADYLRPQRTPKLDELKPPEAHDTADYARAEHESGERTAGPATDPSQLAARYGMPAIALHATRIHRESLLQSYRAGRLRKSASSARDAFFDDEVGAEADALLEAAAKDSPLETAGSRNEDPFKRYLFVLEALERAGRDPGRRHLLPKLQAASDELWKHHGDEIAASFESAQTFTNLAALSKEWNTVRELYFGSLVHSESLAATLAALAEKIGPDQLSAGILDLRHAIVADLASPAVLADKTRRTQQHVDLERHRTLWSLLADAAAFRWQPLRTAPPPQQVLTFLSGLLDYLAGPANERKFNAICSVIWTEGKITEPQRNQVRNYMKRKLPLTLWNNEEARESLFPRALRRHQTG